MKKLIFVVLALVSSRLPAAPAPAFPQADSDLAPDPAAHFGSLPNGVRYVVRANHEPKDRLSLRLLVLSGSLEEADDQQGLAHFLEHLAFNGSTHYPPGTLVEYFQRLGMSFGGDANAYTSFDHTAFEIELPDVKPATIAEGLRVFSDFAGGLLLRPDMIAKERPIILAEKRARDSVEYRQFVASFQFLLGDSLLPRRLPIGLQPVIEQSARDRFVRLYDTWYRPERMVVIAVGDIDPAAVERQIAAAFSSVTDRAPAPPAPDLGHVALALGLRPAYHREPEAPTTDVSLDVVAPYSYLPDTRNLRRLHLPRDLAVAMLNRRLEILTRQEGAPFIRGTVAIDEGFNFYHDAGIDLACAPAQWQATMAVTEQELRRALQFGFTAAELREAVANFRNAQQQRAAQAATRRSPDLAAAIIDTLVNRTVFTSPAQDLALYGPALDQVTPAECGNALRVAFGPPGRYVMVSGNAKIDGDAPAAIVAAYNAAHAVEIKPAAAAATDGFAYTDFGPAGAIARRTPVPDLDLTLVTFANGVRVNLKKTPFEANQIRISVRVGAGQLVEPRTEPGLGFFSDLTFDAGGLGRHSADDLTRILAGRNVGLEFKVSPDALTFTATTTRDDLLLQLQLITAYLTDPGYRPEALRLAAKAIDETYNQLAHSTDGPLEAEVPRLLADGDPRFGLPSRETVLGRTLAEEKAWLAPQLARGPIEIGLVGDLDPDATLAALARTLGALPARDPKPAYAAERTVRFPALAQTKEYAVPTEIPKSTVVLFWPTTDASDVRRARRLQVLSEVFDDRLRLLLREKLGGAYSPEAGSEPSDTYAGYGMILAEVVVAPARAHELSTAIRGVAADLQAHGVTADELQRAKEPIMTSLRESVRTNAYWLGAVLSRCQEFPQRLDWARTRTSDIGAISEADLDALARTYFVPDRLFQVISSPVSTSPAASAVAAP
jgi:zinc protease